MEAVFSSHNGSVEPRATVVLKRHGSTQHNVGDHPHGPHVYSTGIGFPQQHLRGQVLRSSTCGSKGPSPVRARILRLCSCAARSGQSKVGNKQPGVGPGVVVQKILRLQVSVGDTQVVQVPHPSQHHLQGSCSVPLCVVAPADHTIQQLPTCGQLQHHVNPLRKLEHLDQLDHIGVAHPLQHRQLRGAHLTALWGLHLHHFYGEGLASGPVLHTHDAAEASSTDQSLDVISDRAEGKWWVITA